EFSIKASSGDTLVISYVGYITSRVQVKNQEPLDILLEPDISNIDELVVVGYGVQKKSDITGSVVSINSEKLTDRPETNILQALQGNMAGLTVSASGSDAEGASTTMLIRGQNSITASNYPLIILDGIPFSGNLSEINPDDIKSIEVLKDASSAAIYGARGANGVILITTKMGKPGKMKVSYDAYYSVDNIAYVPPLMDGKTFYERKKEYGETFTPLEQNNYDAGKFTNWIDEATRTGHKQLHNLSLSGAGKTTRYFISTSYNNSQGVAKNDNFKRITQRINLEQDLNKWAKLGTNTSLGFYNRSGNEADFYNAFRMNPLGNAYNEDGSIALLAWDDPNYGVNPLNALNNLNTNKTKRINSNNYLVIDFPFIEGLNYKLNTGYEYRIWRNQTYEGSNTYEGNINKGVLTNYEQNNENWLVENILSYKNTFGKHSIFLTGLYSAQSETQETSNLEGINFPSDVLTYYQPDKASSLQTSASYVRSTHISQMFRANYGYDARYLFTFTIRRDGYSAFGNNKKFGLFPSFAFGWNLAKENFFTSSSSLSFVNNLKLRLSYGVNGNEAITPYSTLPNLSTMNYLTADYQPAFGFYPKKLGNPDLGWETTKSFNTGLDFAFWDNRVTGLLDVYFSHTYDLLLDKTISPQNGDNHIISNIGETRNHGIEFQISSVNISNFSKFKWRTDLTFARNRNEIVNVGLKDENGNYIDDIASKWFIGEPINVNYDYVFAGVWQENDDIANSPQPTAHPGDVKYKDVNNDGIISVEDKTIIGSRIPNFVIGLTNTFTYGDFSLSFLINAVKGVTYPNILLNTGQISFRVNSYDKNFWSPDNPTNDYPQNTDRDVNPLDMHFYEDASFVRLQNVTLTYNIPDKFLTKIMVKNLDVYINLKNPATWTKWTGLDPEFLSLSPIDRQRSSPQLKSVLFGVRLSF
ncbi:MAG TPA: TonB-dependent receptor, partial [Bacteroidales bacterium]|nr:TonB-dependent receptor [Bacteroidales bacterium]